MIRIENNKEKLALEAFQKRTEDLNQTEETLLRFLRARDHNIPKAEEMLRKSLKWREEKCISTYLLWVPPKFLADDFIFRYSGHDYEGRPVMWFPLGRWNGRVFIEQGHKEECIKFCYYILETNMKRIRDSGTSQAIMIYSMEELTMWKMANIETMQLLYGNFQDLEQNYPEIIKSLYVVNAPWVFSFGYNFIKPILSSHTVSKIKIFNADYKKWYEELLKVMPEESIPNEIKKLEK